MNTYHELVAAARAANDLDAITWATMARDLSIAGAIPAAASNARLARARLAALAAENGQ